MNINSSYIKHEKSIVIPKNERKYATIAEIYKECEENIKDYLHPNISLKLSSPYLDQYMFDHIYKIDNKSKWVDKKGFKNYINSSLNSRKYFDSNTVFEREKFLKEEKEKGNLSKKSYVLKNKKDRKQLYIDNPTDIKFRHENKAKWVDKKGFIVKNAKDYLIKATEEYNIKNYQDLYD